MANQPGPWTDTRLEDWKSNFDTIEHTIQGKMISVQLTLPEYERIALLSGPDGEMEIKRRLLDQLVSQLFMDMKCVEFTKYDSFASMETHYRARMFLVPDTQVRIIRQIYQT